MDGLGEWVGAGSSQIALKTSLGVEFKKFHVETVDQFVTVGY